MKLSGVQQRTRVVDFVTDEVSDWSEWKDICEDDVFTWESTRWQVQTRVTPGFVQDAVRKAKQAVITQVRQDLVNMSNHLYEV